MAKGKVWTPKDMNRPVTKKINCLIPAKGKSKRIPHKNLIDFCGKPLMVWSIEQALVCKGIDKVYVSSEDAEILDVAVLNGAEIVLRPEGLAGDSSTLEEVIEHFLKEVPTDTLVVLQPTSPLRLPGDIDTCLKIAYVHHIAISCNIEDDLYLWQKVDYGKSVDSWTFDYPPRYKYDDSFRENGSIYVINPIGFEKTKSRYGTGRIKLLSFYPMQKWQSYEIDEPEDVRVCEALMKEFIKNKKEVVL